MVHLFPECVESDAFRATRWLLEELMALPLLSKHLIDLVIEEEPLTPLKARAITLHSSTGAVAGLAAVVT